jgi:murein L,D-transpeptidase YafK
MPADTPSNKDEAPVRTGKKLRLRPPLFLLIIAAAVGAFAFETFWPATADYYWIRAQRYFQATMGFALSGTPDLANLQGRLDANDVALGAPIFMRIFKREFELELWMMRDGKFHRFATYPICNWSGRLGPKLAQGDRQSPEGFYTVDETQLNPNSRWRRSFNLGFPNAFDRAHGRTGDFLMVHGGCGSIGCYAMTNPVIDEVWKLVTAALRGGQKRFQVQVLPFRLSEEDLARHADQPNTEFWRSLKPGYDMFEADLVPPKVSVCNGRYAFEPGAAGSNGDAVIEARCTSPKPGV